jgi:adenosylcobinamide-GDP ribazoletransferase
MAFFRRLLLAFQFMTRIPLPFDAHATEADFAACSVFYPVTSLVVGGFMLLVYGLLLFTGLSLLSAFAAVMSGYLVTGALHLDGFADCCDAFFAKKPKEDTLRILKDSRMGAFGVLGIVFDVGFKTLLIYALCNQKKADMAFVLLSMPVAGKLPLIIAPAIAGYARPEGTGKSMIGNIKPLYIVVCILLAAGILAAFFGKGAAIAAPVLLLAGILTAERSKKRIGGITGDVLGAANEIGEMLFLLALLVIYAV